MNSSNSNSNSNSAAIASSRCSCCERSLASVILTFDSDCASFPLCLSCLGGLPIQPGSRVALMRVSRDDV